MSDNNLSKITAVREWMVAIVSALLIAVVIRLFLFAPYEVHGTSMSPTLDGDELLVVNKWIYSVKKPEYGDVVVFHTEEQRDFIKRIIGLPGDKILIENGHLFRNGELVKEDYIQEKMEGDLEETTVPKDSLFVLGDNRNNSKDSRVIGSIQMKDVVGRADVVILPIHQFHLLIK